ncbi:MAG: isochorismatase family protein [Pseudomonadota bacterium]
MDHISLLLIDLQNDFFPGGTLPVRDAHEIVGPTNEYIRKFSDRKLPIFVSRDWHPPVSGHFKKGGGNWPPHCVQGTEGARFYPEIRVPPNAIVISKGMDPEEDAYSDFQGCGPDEKAFGTILGAMGIMELYVAGLATDYCVQATVLDACSLGYRVTILLDGIRGVNIDVNDSARAIDRMLRACAKTATLETVFT